MADRLDVPFVVLGLRAWMQGLLPTNFFTVASSTCLVCCSGVSGVVVVIVLVVEVVAVVEVVVAVAIEVVDKVDVVVVVVVVAVVVDVVVVDVVVVVDGGNMVVVEISFSSHVSATFPSPFTYSGLSSVNHFTSY